MPQSASSEDLFSSLLTEQDVMCRLPATTRDAFLAAMVEHAAARHGLGNPAEILKSVVDREQTASTNIADHVAVPHARIAGLPKPLLIVGTSKNGVLFREDAAVPVHLVILVLVPRESPAIYLQVLAGLAPIFKSDAVAQVGELAAPADVVRFLRNGGMSLPDYVCAANIMSPVTVSLLDTNSVKDAIDLIVRNRIADIPVVDKDGDIVGVVTAGAILRVCIPDYFLWMEDLSRFRQFEPFATLLATEADVWLKDVTDEEYAAVQADQPAIAVAEVMARHNTRVCFVLDGTKLVGIITLPHFFDKIFRD